MELSLYEQTLASVSGGGLTALTMTPFDVVKGKASSTGIRHNFVFSTGSSYGKTNQLLQWAYGSHDLSLWTYEIGRKSGETVRRNRCIHHS